MKYVLPILLAVTFLFSSCGNETGDVNLNFRLTFDGEPLVQADVIDYPLGYDVFFSKISMFLSDVSLEGDDGTVELRDVIFLNFLEEQVDAASAAEGIDIRISDLPKGNYTKLNYALGVPETQNAMNPSDFESASDLSNTGEYWAGWSSYIFHKTEGKIDADGDGEFEKNVALHIGSNAAYRSSSKTIDFDIVGDAVSEIAIVIDVKDMLVKDGASFDINAMPQVHSEMALPNVLSIMDGIISAINE